MTTTPKNKPLASPETPRQGCEYLQGLNIRPRSVIEARKLVGKRVKYLRDTDIDRSGRGFYFPRTGTVQSAESREIVIDGDYVSLSRIREMIVIDSDAAAADASKC